MAMSLAAIADRDLRGIGGAFGSLVGWLEPAGPSSALAVCIGVVIPVLTNELGRFAWYLEHWRRFRAARL